MWKSTLYNQDFTKTYFISYTKSSEITVKICIGVKCAQKRGEGMKSFKQLNKINNNNNNNNNKY